MIHMSEDFKYTILYESLEWKNSISSCNSNELERQYLVG